MSRLAGVALAACVVSACAVSACADGSGAAGAPPTAADVRAPAAPDAATDASGCVVFAGDVALGRGIAAELARRGAPWGAFPPGDAWIANLEGTVAVGACAKAPATCLGFAESALDHLADGPFRALSLANNHADDHGPAGRAATVAALRARGIVPLEEGARATHVTVAGLDLALVPVNLAGVEAAPALERARLALALARARTPWVVALPHWGVEGVAGLGPGQAHTDAILRAWGATLVVGAGAHRTQPSTCHADAATWYGLGNHLFDQVPPPTHEGAVVRCCPGDGGLVCTETRARRTASTPLPRPVPGEVATCAIPEPPPADRAWERHPWGDRFRSVQRFRSVDGWLGLREAWNDIDDEVALRPYVFRMTDTGFDELWSGSALARPLIAARLFEHRGEELLCALHRGDSFIHPDPDTPARVWRVYRWNGFGFRGVDDPAAAAACAAM